MARFGKTAIALMAALCFSAPAAAQNLTKKELQDVYVDYLAKEGYRPEVTNAGNVRFRREGKAYLVYVDDKDPPYFRLVFSLLAEDKSREAHLRRLDAANVATKETKVVKVYVDDDGDPTFVIETFQGTPGDAQRHLTRYFDAIDLAYQKYIRKFRESAP